jgi:hypothetical protein
VEVRPVDEATLAQEEVLYASALPRIREPADYTTLGGVIDVSAKIDERDGPIVDHGERTNI